MLSQLLLWLSLKKGERPKGWWGAPATGQFQLYHDKKRWA
jgi:hypothetical protein